MITGTGLEQQTYNYKKGKPAGAELGQAQALLGLRYRQATIAAVQK